MARTKFSELRHVVVAKPGATERLATCVLRRSRRSVCTSFAMVRRSVTPNSRRLDVTHGAISKLVHSDDLRVSKLRQYLEALVPAWSSSPCSTTMIVASRSTSDGTPLPEDTLQPDCNQRGGSGTSPVSTKADYNDPRPST